MDSSCHDRTTVGGFATVGALAGVVGGRLSPNANPDAPLGRIAIDSRVVEPGDVFWALRGPNHRGEEFLDDAFRRGAAGAVVAAAAWEAKGEDRRGKGTEAIATCKWHQPCPQPLAPSAAEPQPNPADRSRRAFKMRAKRATVLTQDSSPSSNSQSLISIPFPWLLQIPDTHAALDAWARWRREQFRGTAVAVTGSSGKSTAREMIHAVLQSRLRGTASPNNFNNHIGVPMSMTSIAPDDDYAVLELGASGPGEIARLAELVRPTLGVITCVGDAHLGGFGSRKKIAEAKAELLTALPPDGTAILADDPLLRKIVKKTPSNILWIGDGANCDVRAKDVRNLNGRLAFCVEDCWFSIPVAGRHFVVAALAAIAVGKILGFDLDSMARSLYKFRPLPMRCQVQEVGGATLINDAYNSNPTAFRAALELLREFNPAGRRIVVAGDMGELGRRSAALHRAAGRQAVEIAQPAWLIACGRFAGDMIAGARAAGMPRGRAVAFRDADDATLLVEAILAPNDVVLLKGSRMTAMERVAEALMIRRRCSSCSA